MTPQPGPSARSPFNDPDTTVTVRLAGTPAAIARVIEALATVTTVTEVSGPLPTNTPGRVRVSLSAVRRSPVIGGAK